MPDGGIGSLSNSTTQAPAPISRSAVPALVSKSCRQSLGSLSIQAISLPAGISSRTVTLVPCANEPASRHDHADGSSKAGFASVLMAGPPLTVKLN